MKNSFGNVLMQDYTYELPHSRIAVFPLEQRDQSRLLIYENGTVRDDHFYHLSIHLNPGSTIIVNNTRVIEARIIFLKDTGARIEIFCLEPYGTAIETAMMQQGSATWKCLIGGASKWKPGTALQKKIETGDGVVILEARYKQKEDEAFLIEFSWTPAELPFIQVLHAAGAIPLPPYIKRSAQVLDSERYQTVFSKLDGSVAAPTAALHFTAKQFEELKKKEIAVREVTLHVGAGTFKPVKAASVSDHAMHAEPFTVRRETIEHLLTSKEIIAVGTTSLRTLESLYWIGLKIKKEGPKFIPVLSQWEAYDLTATDAEIPWQQSLQYILGWMKENDLDEISCKTSLIIVPGYHFHIPKGLITNFHQPGSTLLLLVAAFIGEDWKKVYAHALENDYRFLSYGDSSLLWRIEN